MKIEIELSEEDAACLWANFLDPMTVSEIVSNLAVKKAFDYKNAFPREVETAVTAFRESQAKKGAQA